MSTGPNNYSHLLTAYNLMEVGCSQLEEYFSQATSKVQGTELHMIMVRETRRKLTNALTEFHSFCLCSVLGGWYGREEDEKRN